MRNLEEFNGKHKGKICFVVGAGPSIHFQDLEPLKNHVTIAVNSGYLAVPEADYFISDDWSISRWSYYFDDLKKSQHTIALLYENKLASSAPLFGNRSVLFRHRKGISIPDVYDHKNSRGHIGETRTSVGSAIMVAHIMGCSHIALIGIDCCRLRNLRYFWQMQGYDQPTRNDGIPVDRYKRCKVRGQTTDMDLVDISRTWNKLGNAINKKCKVYNVSDMSILRVFPKINLEKFIDEYAS